MAKNNPIVTAIGALVVGIALFWAYAVPPILDWWAQYGDTVILIISLIAITGSVIGIVILVLNKINKRKAEVNRKQEEEAEAEAAFKRAAEERAAEERAAAAEKAREDEYKKKGYVSYTNRFGKKEWDTQEKIVEIQKNDEEQRIKESFPYRVKEEINAFIPEKKFKHEDRYRDSLSGWLQRTFSQTVTEKQTRSSRPDIIIDNIGIEIKGPTTQEQLNTIPNKIMKYTDHYDVLIIVLFDLVVPIHKHGYIDWKNGIDKLKDLPTIGDIEIIEKNEFRNEKD